MKAEKSKKYRKWNIWCIWTFLIPICPKQISHVDFTDPIFWKKCENHDFEKCYFWVSFSGVEISNQPSKIRVSKNRENHVFECIILEYVESSDEQSPASRKMFRCYLRIEKSILLNLDFASNCNFEWKWKSTLQRMVWISKLGFEKF